MLKHHEDEYVNTCMYNIVSIMLTGKLVSNSYQYEKVQLGKWYV